MPCVVVMVDRDDIHETTVTHYLTFEDAVNAVADEICEAEDEDGNSFIAEYDRATRLGYAHTRRTLHRATIVDTLMNWRPDDPHEVSRMVRDYYGWPFVLMFHEVQEFHGAGTGR